MSENKVAKACAIRLNTALPVDVDIPCPSTLQNTAKLLLLRDDLHKRSVITVFQAQYPLTPLKMNESMANDYSNWTVSKLQKELKRVETAIATKEKQERKSAMVEIRAMAKTAGIKLSELTTTRGRPAKAASVAPKKRGRPPGKAHAKTRAKVPPKYGNPEDATQTWTGRGRKPLWVVAHLDSGGQMESITL